jgi:hypothetical protein
MDMEDEQTCVVTLLSRSPCKRALTAPFRDDLGIRRPSFSRAGSSCLPHRTMLAFLDATQVDFDPGGALTLSRCGFLFRFSLACFGVSRVSRRSRTGDFRTKAPAGPPSKKVRFAFLRFPEKNSPLRSLRTFLCDGRSRVAEGCTQESFPPLFSPFRAG